MPVRQRKSYIYINDNNRQIRPKHDIGKENIKYKKLVNKPDHRQTGDFRVLFRSANIFLYFDEIFPSKKKYFPLQHCILRRWFSSARFNNNTNNSDMKIVPKTTKDFFLKRTAIISLEFFWYSSYIQPTISISPTPQLHRHCKSYPNHIHNLRALTFAFLFFFYLSAKHKLYKFYFIFLMLKWWVPFSKLVEIWCIDWWIKKNLYEWLDEWGIDVWMDWLCMDKWANGWTILLCKMFVLVWHTRKYKNLLD